MDDDRGLRCYAVFTLLRVMTFAVRGIEPHTGYSIIEADRGRNAPASLSVLR